MSEYRIASRYAKSLLELAKEQDQLEEVHNDMMLFKKICEENRDFTLMLKNPIITHDKKLSILESLFKDSFNKLSLAIFTIITRKNREPILPSISKEFHVQYNISKGIEQATLTTAIQVDEDLLMEFKKLITTISEKEVELAEIVDNEIIGGFQIKIGDRQIDNTLKTRLNELALDFKENPYKKTI